MKLKNWQKIVYWVILVIILSSILYMRLEAITSGHSAPMDVFLFLIFVALLLLPLFSEIDFLGVVKLKKDVEGLNDKIDIKFGEITNEIRISQAQNQAQNQNQHFTQYFGLPQPPPDNLIPEIEKEIDRIIKDRVGRFNFVPSEIPLRLDVPRNNLALFKIRFNIEKELRRIWDGREFYTVGRREQSPLPLIKIMNDLVRNELINDNFSGILKEIISICNYAIHGEQVSPKQVTFAIKYSNEIIDYLRFIK